MEAILDLIPALFGLIRSLFMLALPFLLLYAIYRAIKALMTHNANLKNQQNNDRWNNPESR